PSAVPPHKDAGPVIAHAHRMEMVRRAVADRPGFAASDAEGRRGGRSFTVETLEQFQLEFGPEARLHFIAGLDAVLDVHTWKDLAQFVRDVQRNQNAALSLVTMMFLLVILGSTDARAPQGLAPIAIGLCLTLIHLISIPVTNTSVNPARSTGVAIFAGGWALQQLWLFWVAPMGGAVLGALVYRFIGAKEQ
ncbi:MAG: aquaporin, partial [Desulfobacterales bacterium]|nr:aquaporin [Desulfobacterales bacterium]